MQMKLCAAKLHYYDPGRYQTCPYCASKNDDENDRTVAFTGGIPGGLDDGTVAIGEGNTSAFGQDLGTYSPGVEVQEEEEVDKTVPMTGTFENIFDEDPPTGRSSLGGDPSIPEDIDDIFGGNGGGYGTTEPYGGVYGTTEPYGGGGTMTTQPFVEDDDDGGKTIGFFEAKKVAGWLVCVKGSEKGKDFVIGSGRNFIGRSPSMDISLAGDPSVSRENHAIIVYNPRGNNFSITYGTGHGIIYLNGQEVLTPMKLNPYDQIEIGRSVLIFIPFCGESFKWEEK